MICAFLPGERFVAVLKASPTISRNYQPYTLAYTESFEIVFVVPAALTGLVGLLSLLIKEHTLDKVLSSELKSSERKHLGNPQTTCAKSKLEDKRGGTSDNWAR